ncbi:MAG: tetratricopeptide repeat protein [Anaerolineae bacterium]
MSDATSSQSIRFARFWPTPKSYPPGAGTPGPSDLKTAYQHARQSLTLAGDIERLRAYALDALGQVEAARQNWGQAVEHFERSIALRSEGGDRHLAARTQRHYAEMLLQKGEPEEAVELFQAALATFQELGLAHEVAETQRLLDTGKTQKG